MTDTAPAGPLAGLRVLDISTVVAAPFAATLLADYGADVVKAELPGEGDGLRTFPPFKEGKSLWWKVANRGKRFIELDLRTPEGADLFRRMLPDMDVVIENFRPGTLERWGLGPDDLLKINPSLVLLRVTGFGQTGPAANRPGFARLFEAMSGLTYMTGEPDRAPMHAGHPMGDSIGGVFGALAVTTALLSVRSDPEKRGQVVDLSLTEAMFRLLDFQTIGYDQLGKVVERTGNRNQYSAPADVYPTQDGRYISLAGSTQATFRNNLRAIGREDLLSDPRFAGNAQRVENVEAIDAIFRAWFAAHTQDHAIARFREAGGTLAPILSIDQIFEDPQFQAREAIVPVPDDDFGEVKMQAVVPRFSRTPARPGRAAGALGRDTEAVLRPYRAAPDPARQD
ncbi:CoA transferase [Albimonas sp. CAU 1670]|uniref:CaiB/BaiF CoA transferase family protein n=1 Tax=Albimonas sp. CAU 1670 TaxID=3032599 RepID=UPI0023DB8AF0|nr:CoA transferase [Albimonas sp. CAU 1670]MDF2234112.1 CoA transferase [Albimonas sp. CAU 1670]